MENKLLDYFDNALSLQEQEEVEAWIDSSEENREVARQLYMLHYVGQTLEVMQRVDSKEALRRVNARIASSRRRVIWSRISSVAAMLFIPVVAVALYALCNKPAAVEEVVQCVEMYTTSGMVSCVTLPDGSKVWLNSNSYLKYPVRFGQERCVELEGEGYFDVAKDEAHKFVVRTNTMTVEVLGTEFNVDAYARRGRDVRTTLVEGSINMTFEGSDNREHIVALRPGQRVSIDPVSHDWNIRKVNTSATASWKEGRIVFDKTPLVEALRMIENRFNVEFVVKNPNFYEHNFTGMFTDQRLDVILEHFKRSSNMRFRTIDRYGEGNVKGYEVIEIY